PCRGAHGPTADATLRGDLRRAANLLVDDLRIGGRAVPAGEPVATGEQGRNVAKCSLALALHAGRVIVAVRKQAAVLRVAGEAELRAAAVEVADAPAGDEHVELVASDVADVDGLHDHLLAFEGGGSGIVGHVLAVARELQHVARAAVAVVGGKAVRRVGAGGAARTAGVAGSAGAAGAAGARATAAAATGLFAEVAVHQIGRRALVPALPVGTWIGRRHDIGTVGRRGTPSRAVGTARATLG